MKVCSIIEEVKELKTLAKAVISLHLKCCFKTKNIWM